MNDDDAKLITRFDDIYNLPDCTKYYQAMHAARFQNAQYAVKAFKIAARELCRQRNTESLHVLDFASGYGIGSLLLRHDLSLEQVLERYQGEEFEAANPVQVMEWDRDWLLQNRKPGNIASICAIDVANHALDYGAKTGIFDSAFAIDLQSDSPSDELVEKLRRCDLLIEVGSVIHMLPDTLKRLLDLSAERLPWIITSPIRGNESAESVALMKNSGMVVEKLPVPPFPHRRFLDRAEQERATRLLGERGHDTDGYESTGSYHAQLYLSRPEQESGWNIYGAPWD